MRNGIAVWIRLATGFRTPQSLDLQRDALREAGVSDDAIYEDQASGQREDRPGLAAFLKAARQGDVESVHNISQRPFH